MKSVRVRFAPSPTGLMHLGNVRSALINFLFARQKNGTFIIRIEDTDPERNFDPGAIHIQEDLAWLGLTFDEGPGVNGDYGPYFQSERTAIYQKHFAYLQESAMVYRCFCTEEELEKKRARQIALKQPPRYDRTCTHLNQEEIQKKLTDTMPFIWRFKIDPAQTLTITDLARGPVTFHMQNFSDFPITRKNGSFTFIFANVVDDITMRISHVFRGEDHLSNTANQAAIYIALKAHLPIFWHMPILCNIDGKKLSKRDFGFSLKDLKDAGFLPEAILNYLAILGGSFKKEIMNLDELTQAIDFEHLQPTGQIRYDFQKLLWINHQWILKSSVEELLHACKEYIYAEFPAARELSQTKLLELVALAQGEMKTLVDVKSHLAFYFRSPTDACEKFAEYMQNDEIRSIGNLLKKIDLASYSSSENFISDLKKESQNMGIKPKSLYTFLRLALTSSISGPSIIEIIDTLGKEEAAVRINAVIQAC